MCQLDAHHNNNNNHHRRMSTLFATLFLHLLPSLLFRIVALFLDEAARLLNRAALVFHQQGEHDSHPLPLDVVALTKKKKKRDTSSSSLSSSSPASTTSRRHHHHHQQQQQQQQRHSNNNQALGDDDPQSPTDPEPMSLCDLRSSSSSTKEPRSANDILFQHHHHHQEPHHHFAKSRSTPAAYWPVDGDDEDDTDDNGPSQASQSYASNNASTFVSSITPNSSTCSIPPKNITLLDLNSSSFHSGPVFRSHHHHHTLCSGRDSQQPASHPSVHLLSSIRQQQQHCSSSSRDPISPLDDLLPSVNLLPSPAAAASSAQRRKKLPIVFPSSLSSSSMLPVVERTPTPTLAPTPRPLTPLLPKVEAELERTPPPAPPPPAPPPAPTRQELASENSGMAPIVVAANKASLPTSDRATSSLMFEAAELLPSMDAVATAVTDVDTDGSSDGSSGIRCVDLPLPPPPPPSLPTLTLGRSVPSLGDDDKYGSSTTTISTTRVVKPAPTSVPPSPQKVKLPGLLVSQRVNDLEHFISRDTDSNGTLKLPLPCPTKTTPSMAIPPTALLRSIYADDLSITDDDDGNDDGDHGGKKRINPPLRASTALFSEHAGDSSEDGVDDNDNEHRLAAVAAGQPQSQSRARDHQGRAPTSGDVDDFVVGDSSLVVDASLEDGATGVDSLRELIPPNAFSRPLLVSPPPLSVTLRMLDVPDVVAPMDDGPRTAPLPLLRPSLSSPPSFRLMRHEYAELDDANKKEEVDKEEIEEEDSGSFGTLDQQRRRRWRTTREVNVSARTESYSSPDSGPCSTSGTTHGSGSGPLAFVPNPIGGAGNAAAPVSGPGTAAVAGLVGSSSGVGGGSGTQKQQQQLRTRWRKDEDLFGEEPSLSFDDDDDNRLRTRPEDMDISPVVQRVESMATTVCESEVAVVELGEFELDREAPSIELGALHQQYGWPTTSPRKMFRPISRSEVNAMEMDDDACGDSEVILDELELHDDDDDDDDEEYDDDDYDDYGYGEEVKGRDQEGARVSDRLSRSRWSAPVFDVNSHHHHAHPTQEQKADIIRSNRNRQRPTSSPVSPRVGPLSSRDRPSFKRVSDEGPRSGGMYTSNNMVFRQASVDLTSGLAASNSNSHSHNSRHRNMLLHSPTSLRARLHEHDRPRSANGVDPRGSRREGASRFSLGGMPPGVGARTYESGGDGGGASSGGDRRGMMARPVSDRATRSSSTNSNRNSRHVSSPGGNRLGGRHSASWNRNRFDDWPEYSPSAPIGATCNTAAQPRSQSSHHSDTRSSTRRPHQQHQQQKGSKHQQQAQEPRQSLDDDDDDDDSRVGRRHASDMSFGASDRKAAMLPPELLGQPDKEAEDAFWNMPDRFVGGVRPRRRRRFVRLGGGGGGGQDCDGGDVGGDGGGDTASSGYGYGQRESNEVKTLVRNLLLLRRRPRRLPGGGWGGIDEPSVLSRRKRARLQHALLKHHHNNNHQHQQQKATGGFVVTGGMGDERSGGRGRDGGDEDMLNKDVMFESQLNQDTVFQLLNRICPECGFRIIVRRGNYKMKMEVPCGGDLEPLLVSMQLFKRNCSSTGFGGSSGKCLLSSSSGGDEDDNDDDKEKDDGRYAYVDGGDEDDSSSRRKEGRKREHDNNRRKRGGGGGMGSGGTVVTLCRSRDDVSNGPVKDIVAAATLLEKRLAEHVEFIDDSFASLYADESATTLDDLDEREKIRQLKGVETESKDSRWDDRTWADIANSIEPEPSAPSAVIDVDAMIRDAQDSDAGRVYGSNDEGCGGDDGGRVGSGGKKDEEEVVEDDSDDGDDEEEEAKEGGRRS